MEHLELHVVKSPRDVELAHIAGLLESGPDATNTEFLSMSCELCNTLIEFSQDVDLTPTGMILVSEHNAVSTCDSCLGFAIQAVVV
jgi:hypothetical protein